MQFHSNTPRPGKDYIRCGEMCLDTRNAFSTSTLLTQAGVNIGRQYVFTNPPWEKLFTNSTSVGDARDYLVEHSASSVYWNYSLSSMNVAGTGIMQSAVLQYTASLLVSCSLSNKGISSHTTPVAQVGVINVMDVTDLSTLAIPTTNNAAGTANSYNSYLVTRREAKPKYFECSRPSTNQNITLTIFCGENNATYPMTTPLTTLDLVTPSTHFFTFYYLRE